MAGKSKLKRLAEYEAKLAEHLKAAIGLQRTLNMLKYDNTDHLSETYATEMCSELDHHKALAEYYREKIRQLELPPPPKKENPILTWLS